MPAAVISRGIYTAKWEAPTRTALYPAILAWELSASIAWAKVVLGIKCIENPVIFLSFNFITFSNSFVVWKSEIKIEFSGNDSISSNVGERTFKIRFAPTKVDFGSDFICAPASE